MLRGDNCRSGKLSFCKIMQLSNCNVISMQRSFHSSLEDSLSTLRFSLRLHFLFVQSPTNPRVPFCMCTDQDWLRQNLPKLGVSCFKQMLLDTHLNESTSTLLFLPKKNNFLASVWCSPTLQRQMFFVKIFHFFYCSSLLFIIFSPPNFISV